MIIYMYMLHQVYVVFVCEWLVHNQFHFGQNYYHIFAGINKLLAMWRIVAKTTALSSAVHVTLLIVAH